MPRNYPKQSKAVLRVFLYLRLSVDKEDGHAKSIEAQRHEGKLYADHNGMIIVGEYVDSGISGRSSKRPKFLQMIADATDPSRPVDAILFYRQARFARNMRVFFNALGDLADAGVEVISITENFGQGRNKRMGQTFTAMMDEQRSIEDSINTCKSRRHNARDGFYNGGPVAFGYETYVALRQCDKDRKKLRILPDESSIVSEVFDWADIGRGNRWIVKILNERGTTFRGRKFSNSNVAGILSRETYVGFYYDKTADDDGNAPERENWISVNCPSIITRAQFDRVAASRASRNPRRTAPHIAAGTTMLTGIARCGIAGCKAGMTIHSAKSGRYHYYSCNAKVNNGQRCESPNVRRERLDEVVLKTVEKQLLAPERLRALMQDVLELSDQKRAQIEQELSQAKSERTRLRTANEHLLDLLENPNMKAQGDIFLNRIAKNQSALAAASSRIDTLETQLATGARKITNQTIDRFGKLLSAKLNDDDPALRKAYIRMFVSEVSVSPEGIIISGPTGALENGISKGAPRLEATVPIFDREWCPWPDSNGHSLRNCILSGTRLTYITDNTA